METLLWLVPIPVAVVYALIRNAWVTRLRPPEDPADSLARYERFRAVVQGSPTSPPPPATRRRRR